jgi:NRE family putative nickel resistance protein-like MFS transporter
LGEQVKTIPDSRPSSIGYLDLIRTNRDFRLLWFGQIVSLLGDWFDLIASASLVAKLTGSGLGVGALFVVRFIAPFLISPLAGVWVDRYNRKHLLILADLSRAVIVIGFLLVRGPRHTWLLYTLTTAQLAIGGIFFPGRNAILPDLVSERELGAANTLGSSTWATMLAIGSALGGLAAGKWGIYPAFLIDSSTFLLSALLISRIHYRKPIALADAGEGLLPAMQQYADGLRYLKRHADVLAIGMHKAAMSLAVYGVFNIIQITIARGIFVIGEEGAISLGLQYMVGGLGTGLGPIITRRLTGDREPWLRAALGSAYALAMLGLITISTLRSLPLVLLGTFLLDFGGGINWVFSTQLLMRMLPNRVRGRVFSTEFAFFTLTSALSAGLGGRILDHAALELSAMLRWLGFLALAPAIPWTLWLLHQRRALGAAAKLDTQ